MVLGSDLRGGSIMSNHIIAQCTWQSHFDDKSTTIDLQNYLSCWSNTELLDELQTFFDQVCPATQTWSIDQLTLDLGIINLVDLPEELPKRLRINMQDTIAHLLTQKQFSIGYVSDDDLQILDKDSSLQNYVIWFLLNGTSPWWFSGAQTAHQIFDEQLENNPDGMSDIVRELGKTETVRRRIVWQLGENRVKKIIHLVEPLHSEFIFSYAENLNQIQVGNKLPLQGGSEFRQQTWLCILSYLLVDRGTLFNTIAFVRATIQQFAQRYQLDYRSLLAQLSAAVESLDNMGSTAPSCLAVIVTINQQDQIEKINTVSAPEPAIDHWGILQRLLHHALPTLSVNNEVIHLEALFISLLDENPIRLASLLRKEGKNSKVRKGILEHFSQSSLTRLVQVLAPQDAQFILANTELTQTTLAELHIKGNMVWRGLLIYLFADRGSHFNRRQFVFNTLMTICRQLRIDYLLLLDGLMNQRSLRQLGEQDFELLTILQVLSDDDRKQRVKKPAEADLYVKAMNSYLRTGEQPESIAHNRVPHFDVIFYSLARSQYRIFFTANSAPATPKSSNYQKSHSQNNLHSVGESQSLSLIDCATKSTLMFALEQAKQHNISDLILAERLLKLIKPTDFTILLDAMHPHAKDICLDLIKQIQDWHRLAWLPSLQGVDLAKQLHQLTLQALLTFLQNTNTRHTIDVVAYLQVWLITLEQVGVDKKLLSAQMLEATKRQIQRSSSANKLMRYLSSLITVELTLELEDEQSTEHQVTKAIYSEPLETWPIEFQFEILEQQLLKRAHGNSIATVADLNVMPRIPLHTLWSAIIQKDSLAIHTWLMEKPPHLQNELLQSVLVYRQKNNIATWLASLLPGELKSQTRLKALLQQWQDFLVDTGLWKSTAIGLNYVIEECLWHVVAATELKHLISAAMTVEQLLAMTVKRVCTEINLDLVRYLLEVESTIDQQNTESVGTFFSSTWQVVNRQLNTSGRKLAVQALRLTRSDDENNTVLYQPLKPLLNHFRQSEPLQHDYESVITLTIEQARVNDIRIEVLSVRLLKLTRPEDFSELLNTLQKEAHSTSLVLIALLQYWSKQQLLPVLQGVDLSCQLHQLVLQVILQNILGKGVRKSEQQKTVTACFTLKNFWRNFVRQLQQVASFKSTEFVKQLIECLKQFQEDDIAAVLSKSTGEGTADAVSLRTLIQHLKHVYARNITEHVSVQLSEPVKVTSRHQDHRILQHGLTLTDSVSLQVGYLQHLLVSPWSQLLSEGGFWSGGSALLIQILNKHLVTLLTQQHDPSDKRLNVLATTQRWQQPDINLFVSWLKITSDELEIDMLVCFQSESMHALLCSGSIWQQIHVSLMPSLYQSTKTEPTLTQANIELRQLLLLRGQAEFNQLDGRDQSSTLSTDLFASILTAIVPHISQSLLRFIKQLRDAIRQGKLGCLQCLSSVEQLPQLMLTALMNMLEKEYGVTSIKFTQADDWIFSWRRKLSTQPTAKLLKLILEALLHLWLTQLHVSPRVLYRQLDSCSQVLDSEYRKLLEDMLQEVPAANELSPESRGVRPLLSEVGLSQNDDRLLSSTIEPLSFAIEIEPEYWSQQQQRVILEFLLLSPDADIVRSSGITLSQLWPYLQNRQAAMILPWLVSHTQSHQLFQSLVSHRNIAQIDDWLQNLLPPELLPADELIRQWQLVLIEGGLWSGSRMRLRQHLTRIFWAVALDALVSSTGRTTAYLSAAHLLSRMLSSACLQLNISHLQCLNRFQEHLHSLQTSLWKQAFGLLQKQTQQFQESELADSIQKNLPILALAESVDLLSHRSKSEQANGLQTEAFKPETEAEPVLFLQDHGANYLLHPRITEIVRHLLQKGEAPIWLNCKHPMDGERLLHDLFFQRPDQVAEILVDCYKQHSVMFRLLNWVPFHCLLDAMQQTMPENQATITLLEAFHECLQALQLPGLSAQQMCGHLLQHCLSVWVEGDLTALAPARLVSVILMRLNQQYRVPLPVLKTALSEQMDHLPETLQLAIASVLNLHALDPAEKNTMSENHVTLEQTGLPQAHKLGVSDSSRKIFQKIQQTNRQLAMGVPIKIQNAGLVILQDYYNPLKNRLGLIENNEFISDSAQRKAVHCLQFLATGRTNTDETHLMLNKLLCGLPLQATVESEIELSSEEQETCHSLLQAMIDYWGAIGSSSIGGFRGNWLVREGSLTEADDHWDLIIEKRAYDVLLQRSPFSYSIIKLPWMVKPIYVTWPT